MIFDSSNLQYSPDNLKLFALMYTTSPAQSSIPAKYFVFIDTYAKMYSKKKQSIMERLKRLSAGVERLTEARESVTKLQKHAAIESKLLAEKQAEADAALKAITQSMTGTNEQRADIERLKSAAEKENKKIEQQKVLIDQQLREVEPLLAEARKAVGSIKSESLSEIRSLRAPPEAIRDILQVVLLFMGILDTSWEAMRRFLAKSGVKEEIINFDARQITSDVYKKVSSIVKQKEASFDQRNARRASAAAAPLAAWVCANLQYSAILNKIAPLEQERDELERNLGKAEKQMEKLSKGLNSVDQKVAELKKRFELLMKDATQIKIDLDKKQEVIKSAETLVDKLSGEFSRWKEQMQVLQDEYDKLESFSILAAGFIAFLGPTDETTRLNTMDNWKKLFNIPNFDVLEFLVSEIEQLNWKNIGLPPDNLSSENGMIIAYTSETPLIIDPTGRVVNFLMKQFSDRNVQRLSGSQMDFITQVELGVRFGKILVVEDIEDIDPTLITVLRKEIIYQGPRQIIQIGEKFLDYNTNFQLFLCSKNAHLNISHNTKSATVQINFITTHSGLISQMLELAIRTEKPELEVRSNELAKSIENMKVKLEELEQTLLQALVSSEGNILDNVHLLDSLNKSKENAEIIFQSLQESNKLRNELNQQYNVYLPLAERASALYFVISDLHMHSRMYSFNVNTILNLFIKNFEINKENPVTTDRLDHLKRSLQNSVFDYVSRVLFKKDHLIFAMKFVHGIYPNLFLRNEWELFLGLIIEENRPCSIFDNITWIDKERTNYIARIQKYLPTLCNNLKLNDQALWAEFAKTVECEKALPKSVDSIITPFQKIIVIQALRPDRLHSAMKQFLTKTLGTSSLNPSAFSLRDIYQNTSSVDQLILIITDAETDPSQELEELAQSEVGLDKLYQIAMGQGQLQNALDALRIAAEVGGWVCLKNLHLIISSLPAIYKQFCNLTRHKNFRLWLTTEPDDRFPLVLLQTAAKITYEAPPGIKNNLRRTYSHWKDLSLTGDSSYLRYNFLLAWLHALLQERRNFIPQAWTKYYEFNSSDLRTAKEIIKTTMNQTLKWQFIQGLMNMVVYGGRIDNIFDENVLKAYLNQFFHPMFINSSTVEITKDLKIPLLNQSSEYVSLIEKIIPNEDNPILFGLPANIRSSWEIIQSANTIEHLRQMFAGRNDEFTAFDRSKVQTLLSPLLSLWKKLNSQSNFHSMDVPQCKNSKNSIVEVLSLEFAYAVKLVQSIHGSLSALSKYFRGANLPTNVMIMIINSLLIHQTPDHWLDFWNGPREPVQYLSALVNKTKAIKDMLDTAESGHLLSGPIKLSMLFRAHTLLNALKQLTSREKKISMDRLKLVTAWDSSLLKNEMCVELSGIYIQGAIFNNRLTEVSPSSSSYTPTPHLFIAWIDLERNDIYKKEESTLVPLYATMRRDEFVAEIQIPCNHDEAKWQIASVALFLSSY